MILKGKTKEDQITLFFNASNETLTMKFIPIVKFIKKFQYKKLGI